MRRLGTGKSKSRGEQGCGSSDGEPIQEGNRLRRSAPPKTFPEETGFEVRVGAGGLAGRTKEVALVQVIDLAAFRTTPLVRQPFEYLVVPGFIRPRACAAVNADYPAITSSGSFPLSELTFGPAFRSLVEALTGPEMRLAFEEKFAINLRGRPTTVTVRGRCGPRDGRIHTDTPSKIITVLLYMNVAWEEAGGRLRLLRSGDNIEDVITEIPPVEGTLVAFRRSDNSFHGHKPFLGPRRVIQLNWVTGKGSERLTIWRHRLSAWGKRWFRLPQRAAALSAL
jgi:hypothetical protein